MIVDFHTHIFPPRVIEERVEVCRKDHTFRTLYGRPTAKLASADDLLASMERAGVDVSVVLGFAWSAAEDCARHNDYLLEAAARSSGRLVPFCSVQPLAGEAALRYEIERCARGGARGLGELRPADQGYDLAESSHADALASAAAQHGLALLFHVSEPVGHTYPGKAGLPLAAFAAFRERHPGLRLIGAHWGGGLPFFALMPEVKRSLESCWFDTAATRFLYSAEVYRSVIGLLGVEHVLFGSDFPLVSQRTAVKEVEAVLGNTKPARAVLGGNARRFLGIE